MIENNKLELLDTINATEELTHGLHLILFDLISNKPCNQYKKTDSDAVACVVDNVFDNIEDNFIKMKRLCNDSEHDN